MFTVNDRLVKLNKIHIKFEVKVKRDINELELYLRFFFDVNQSSQQIY